MRNVPCSKARRGERGVVKGQDASSAGREEGEDEEQEQEREEGQGKGRVTLSSCS